MKKMKEAERMINCTVDFRCRPVSFGDAMFITDLHEGVSSDDGDQTGKETGERTER